MKNSQLNRQLAGIGNPETREENDYYSSDPSIIDDLFSKVKLEGTIWENACGKGDLSERMKEYGYKVYSSDLIDRGYGKINDYLENPTFYRAQNIVTNPPFKFAKSWVKIALKHTPGKVCILHKIQFLESQERFNELFNIGNLEKVIVYVKKIGFNKGGVIQPAGTMSFAWFVFDRQHVGKPEIDWFAPGENIDIAPSSITDESNGDEKISKVKELLSKGYRTSTVREIMRVEFGEYYTAQQIYSMRTLRCHRKIRAELNERIVSYLPKLSQADEERILKVKELIADGYDRDYICELHSISKYKYYQIHGLYGHCYTVGRIYNHRIKNKTTLSRSLVHQVKKLYSENDCQMTFKSIGQQFDIPASIVSDILHLKRSRNIGKKFNDHIVHFQRGNRPLKSSARRRCNNKQSQIQGIKTQLAA